MTRFSTKISIFVFILIVIGGFFVNASAAEVLQDKIITVRAKVVDVQTKAAVPLYGLDVPSPNQTITVEILKGENKGKIISLDNDYVQLKKGDVFFLSTTIHAGDDNPYYSVAEPDRLPTLIFFAALFLLLVFLIGGKQGLRGVVTLDGSFALIFYVLLPGILNGYSPILITIGVSSLIIVLGSYVTHGFNKTTSAAVVGMITTVVITGILAYIAIHSAKFTGYASDEAVYLSMNARGHIDMLGLLFGGIMIGLLGILYDVAISQAVSVEELHHIAPHVPRKDIFKRAMRIGREHIGALVDTLAIAYAGASLPLLLLFSTPPVDVGLILNREIFATEIIRILIGSIGIILAVPITTLLAVFILVKIKGDNNDYLLKQEQKTLDEYRHHH